MHTEIVFKHKTEFITAVKNMFDLFLSFCLG